MIFKNLLAGAFLLSSATLFAQAPGSKEIPLKQVDFFGQQVVQVSFNGDDEPFGAFTVTDSYGKVVYAIDEAELIHSPNYFTMNIEALEKGEYTFSVKTSKASYQTQFTIR